MATVKRRLTSNPRLDTCKRQSLEVCRVDQADADYFMGGAFGSV